MANKYLNHLTKKAGLASGAVKLWESVSRNNLHSAQRVVEGAREVLEHQGKHPEKYREALTQNHKFLNVAKRHLKQVEHQTKKDTLKVGVGLGAAGAGIIGGIKGYQVHERNRDQEAYDALYKNASFIEALKGAAGKGNFFSKALNTVNTARGGKVKTFWENTMMLSPKKDRQAEATILSRLPKNEQLQRLKHRYPGNSELSPKLKSLHEQQTAAKVAVVGTGAAAGYTGYQSYKLLKRVRQPEQAQPQPQYYY